MKIKGNKTYLTGIGTILGVVGTFVSGQIDLVNAIQLIIPALLAMFIRNGIK